MPAGSLGGRTVRVCMETALEIPFSLVVLVWFFSEFSEPAARKFCCLLQIYFISPKNRIQQPFYNNLK